MRLDTPTRSSLLLGVFVLGAFCSLVASVASAQIPVNTQRRVFHSPVPFPFERLGTSADADGTTVVVGAIGDLVPEPSAQGRAEVWIIDTSMPGTPKLEAVLQPSTPMNAGARFGFDVAIYRDTIVVGAPGSDLAGPSAGAAFVFERTGGAHSPTWTQTATLLPSTSGGNTTTGFGRSVDVHGGLVVVGNIYSNYGVMAFEKQPAGWTSVSGGLDVAGGDAWSFGYSVAVLGNLIAVGMPDYTDDFQEGVEVGSVVVFRRDPRSRNYPWVEADFITAREAVNFERVGAQVELTRNDTFPVSQIVLGASTSHGVRLWYLSKLGQSQSTAGHFMDAAIPAFGQRFDLEADTLLISGDPASAAQAVSMRRRDLQGQWPMVSYFVPPTPPELEGWGSALAISRDFQVVGSEIAEPGGVFKAGWASWISALRP